MLAEGKLDASRFRRLRAVKNVVETVGLSDARFFANRIHDWGGKWLESPMVAALDDWGDPIRCPRLLLGTHRPYSPTTLRYLATALWLKKSGILPEASWIVEIGVGFGGLAAMNSLVSGTVTTLVDLPQVGRAAMHMLKDCVMEHAARIADGAPGSDIPLVISNYAFSELSAKVQDEYLINYLLPSERGFIISNAGIFASSIGGRTDDELVAWLNEAGIPAQISDDCDLLSPIDKLCGVRLIHW